MNLRMVGFGLLLGVIFLGPMAHASNISARLASDPVDGVTLNSFVFGSVMKQYLVGNISPVQARDFVNAHILENMDVVLTASEEADVTAIKTHYETLLATAQGIFLHTIIDMSQHLQDGRITEAEWDGFVGL